MKKQNVDLHLLELRYAHIRVKNEARVRRLADSISRHGQLEAMLTVSGQDGRLILVDGYQRHAALRYLGQDAGLVAVVDEPESQALYQLLIHRGERQWEAIEEAGLIQELHRRFGCSLSEFGRRTGRDKSYVKRRMELLESLPEEVLSRVIAGIISTWAASRVLVPLARANAADATRLAAHLEREPMSTRELQLFYDHYQKANRQVRERMLNSPALFVKSSQALAGSKDESPEERWLHDAKVVCAILDRLRDKADTVFYPNQEQKLRRQLLVRAAKARRLTVELQQKIKERLEYDRPHQRASDPGNGKTGHKKADDRQTAEGLPQHGGQGA
ncbi:MAG: ParB N-terminal domain-containing protein [Proteobacteria bacterium]|nr:ParB N-terminal domain-containing protein [Pseudomonadota bacterium]MBU4296713.1 ParB N-terminal domain-containing protein [Pseudomonadota bacterium]MCG2747465.1 ParB N-terminal domain-containing protein [Desulfobulbaceae bacterium]